MVIEEYKFAGQEKDETMVLSEKKGLIEFLEEKYKEENDKSESDESILLDLENRINTAKTEYEDLGGTYD
jgi:hypothetical protein